jgi:hypothetical protein
VSTKKRVPGSKQLHAQFSRVHISERDFAEAKEYLRTLQRRSLEPVRRALLLAAIVAYARPFSINETSPVHEATAQLPINLKRELTQDEFALHGRLMKLRNEALAHSQYSRKPAGRVMGTATGYLVQFRGFDVLLESIDRKLFEDMCNKLMQFCNRKLFELNNMLESVN